MLPGCAVGVVGGCGGPQVVCTDPTAAAANNNDRYSSTGALLAAAADGSVSERPLPQPKVARISEQHKSVHAVQGQQSVCIELELGSEACGGRGRERG